MLMNISEKINNSKYNMPLKKVKKKSSVDGNAGEKKESFLF